MKRSTILFLATVCLGFTACRNHQTGTGITLRESDGYYSMKASFPSGKWEDVERYMDRQLGSVSNTAFLHTNLDTELKLRDRSLFYIKKYPGHLQIRLDKNRNTPGSYKKIKAVCEGIRQIVSQP